MQSTWEDAHSVALRELVEKGMSFKEIARALNERFGTAYTRNAAIGRARRPGALDAKARRLVGRVRRDAEAGCAKNLREARRRPRNARAEAHHAGTRRRA